MGSASREYLRLNKNILAAFAASLAVSAAAAQLMAGQDDYLNSTYTLMVDYAVYFSVFGGLFYLDNRSKYAAGPGGGAGRARLRRDLAKLATSLGAGEIVYTAARWYLQYHLLTLGYDPYAASLAGHAMSAAIYMVVINVGVRASRLFGHDG